MATRDKVLTTSTSVSFSSGDESSNISLQWGYDLGTAVFSNYKVKLRLYPRVTPDKVVASIGELDYDSTGSMERDEWVTFANSDRARTQFPASLGASFDVNGRVFDGTGNLITDLNLSVDPVTYEIVANKAFFGSVYVKYNTNYRIYTYEPAVKLGGTWSAVIGGGSVNVEYGNVIAIYNGAIATLQVEPPSFDGREDLAELYRVVSETQVNEHGAWEKHSLFDGGGSWGDSNAPLVGDTIMEYDRAHEIGYLSALSAGRVTYRKFFPPIEQGPSSPATYKPQYIFRKKSASEFVDTPYQSSYLSVDFESITARLSDDFPNILPE